MKRTSILIFFIMFVIISNAVSQEIENIITDRPDVSESSFTVPQKFIQIESGFVYSKNRFNSNAEFTDSLVNVVQTEEYVNAPGILARYGLTDKIELRLGAQLTFNRSSYGDPLFLSSTQTDIDGIELAAKFKLADQHEIFPSTAVIVGSSLPSVSTNFFTDLKLQPAIIFCFNSEVTEEFGAGYNLGVNFSDWFNTNSGSGLYSLSLSYSISDKLGMFGEIYGEVSLTGLNAVNYIDGGFTILLKKNLQLDLSGGYGLNSGTTEYFFNTGISFRLPK